MSNANEHGLLTDILAGITALVGHDDGVEALLTAIRDKQISGPSTAATSQSVVPSTDQNPIFDTANGVKTAVTTSTTIITVPAGCTFVRIVTDISIMVNTGGTAAADTSTGGVMILANQPEIIPVTAGEVLKGFSLGASATVRVVPMKLR